MRLNQNHLLIAFALTITAIVVLAIEGGSGDLGGRLGIIDALTGLLLIEGGALAGSQVPAAKK